MMNPPRAVIAEDEPLLRADIRRTLHELWPELIIAAEAVDGEDALQAINLHAPDIVFLDIVMPCLDGLSVAERVAGRCHIVFISAYDQHALAAFESGALDYIVKPFTARRMRKTVERLRERVHGAPAEIKSLLEMIRADGRAAPRYVKWLTVVQGKHMKLVTVGDILYLRADNKYTSLFTHCAEHLLTVTLKEARNGLDPDLFWQVHRSFVVNVNAIDSVYRSFRGTLELRLKEREEMLPVSAAYAHLFRQL